MSTTFPFNYWMWIFYLNLLVLQILLIPFVNAVISSRNLASNLPSKNTNKQFEVVEGSGNLNSGKGAFEQLKKSPHSTPTTQMDEKKWELAGSGASPDDEDGDVDDDIEGSGFEGSGAPPTIQHQKPKITKTTIATTTPSNTLDVNMPMRDRTNKPVSTSASSSTSSSTRTTTKTTPSTTTQRITQLYVTSTTTTTKAPVFNVNTRPTPVLPPLESPDITETDNFEMLKPGILAAISGGAVVGLLMTILLVMFIVYRMRKKDEGSYSLDEGSNHHPNYSYAYQKASTKEFYA